MFYVFCLLVLLVLPEACLWQVFVRGSRVWLQVAFWLPLLAMLLALLAAVAGVWQTASFRLFVTLLLCVALPEGVFTCFALAGRWAGTWWGGAPAAGRVAGAVAALGVCLLFVYGMVWGWKRVTVRRADVCDARLPAAFDGYTIVQLSDLHIGTYRAAPDVVRRIVDSVCALNPDLLVFTGDLVNASPDELDPFMHELARLSAKDGICSVLGNHDYCTYRRRATPLSAGRQLAELKRREHRLGWTLLLNDHRVVRRGADSLVVAGVENDGKPPFPKRADLGRAMRGLSPQAYKVLLSHDPSYWRMAVLPAGGVHLTLSGHTHGMQLRLAGLSPVRLLYREWGGMYEENACRLYVSLGTGSNVPFRVGAWPEINVLTLRRGAAGR